MKTYSINEEQRQEVLKYMWTRPYGEVAQLIAMIASLKQEPIIENSKDKKDKKDN